MLLLARLCVRVCVPIGSQVSHMSTFLLICVFPVAPFMCYLGYLQELLAPVDLLCVSFLSVLLVSGVCLPRLLRFCCASLCLLLLAGIRGRRWLASGSESDQEPDGAVHASLPERRLLRRRRSEQQAHVLTLSSLCFFLPVLPCFFSSLLASISSIISNSIPFCNTTTHRLPHLHIPTPLYRQTSRQCNTPASVTQIFARCAAVAYSAHFPAPSLQFALGSVEKITAWSVAIALMKR